MRALRIGSYIFVALVAVLAGLVWLDSTFGFAGRGRDYVIRLDLPPPADFVHDHSPCVASWVSMSERFGKLPDRKSVV